MQEILDVFVVCLQVLRLSIPLCYKGMKKLLKSIENHNGCCIPARRIWTTLYAHFLSFMRKSIYIGGLIAVFGEEAV
jgi:hypothetical protein